MLISYGLIDDENDEDQPDDNQGDGIGLGVNESEYVHKAAPEEQKDVYKNVYKPPVPAMNPTSPSAKTARCKSCGAMISRDIEAIEQHMEECPGSTSRGSMSTLTFDGSSLRESINAASAHNFLISSKQQQSELQQVILSKFIKIWNNER